MSRPRVLIIYGTSYGQTAKIAARIEAGLLRRGHVPTVINASDAAIPPLTQFDAVMVGSSLIARGHQKSIERFIRAHVRELRTMPSAFFSVSASAGSKSAAGREAAERVRDQFLTHMGWQPELRVCIAGAINYTRYNPLLRWYMKRASAKNGGSTDTSRDHEYTDWKQVDRFAEDFAQLLETSERFAEVGS
jgi:menaquinone-dependent protoporphyrinogen oxidase